MKDALILGLLAIAAWLAIGQRHEPQGLIEDVATSTSAALPAQAVTNPRGEARISLRVAPCVTVSPAPPQMEDDA